MERLGFKKIKSKSTSPGFLTSQNDYLHRCREAVLLYHLPKKPLRKALPQP